MKMIMKSFAILLFLGYTFFLIFHPQTEAVNHAASVLISNGLDMPINNEAVDAPIQYVAVMRGNTQVDLPLEEYLIGVVASEMPVTFELEALKAQAVAARTFASARGYSVDDTTASQVYKDNEQLKSQWLDQYDEYYKKVKQAVEETANQILVYQGEPITAAFFSSCMSATTNAQDYWQNEVPYLRSVASPWDSETVDITRSKEVDDSTLTNALGSSQLAVLSYYDNGYVKTVQAGSQQYTGRQIREMLGLASSCFTIERIENGLRFITYGSGHGIGMSQYGAQGMALAGYTYDEILHHYYTDVEIKTTLV